MNSNNIWIPLFSLTLISINAGIGSCYLPVICIPGITDNQMHAQIKKVCDDIGELHPGTTTIFLQPGGIRSCFLPMWTQIDHYRTKMNEIFVKYPDGVHIIAHSQGTLVARAIIQSTPDHPVKNFLSVSGPFMGQYGLPPVARDIFSFLNLDDVNRENMYKLAYTSFAQNTVSLAGYWNDPTKKKLFMKWSTFLPIINNLIDHPDYNDYKKNFLRLNNTILIGGDGDEVIIPWQSVHAGFYDENLNIIPMKEQNIYTNDTFGLRSLEERGGLTVVDVSGVKHNDYFIDKSCAEKYFLQHLY